MKQVIHIPSITELQDYISLVSDILSIGGFIVSVIIWILFGRFKRQYDNQRADYNLEYKKVKSMLIALRNSLFVDKLNDERTISELRKELNLINRSFKRLLSRRDRYYIKDTLKLLQAFAVDVDLRKLRINLDYLIPLFERKIPDA